jgi:hypothetical protein
MSRYPDDNCLAVFGLAGQPKVPQTEFALYLDHNAGVNIVKPFLNSSAIALANNKPFYMFETNTASCGGFPGISDSYGSGLWALDYGLQMAYSNFSTALLHVGGQNVYYNVCVFLHSWSSPLILYFILAFHPCVTVFASARITTNMCMPDAAPPTNQTSFHQWTIGSWSLLPKLPLRFLDLMAS